ncbi:hypothetical protein RRG08_004700 [Elysia crispata]|uniref:Uncharacterized protein n=1 Tax=Elysia crispata TaxID=231223 RepID=A0AAE1B4Q4_9GAST|nr:hypothetical protein RRG08_004700 [Elysia crispata]
MVSGRVDHTPQWAERKANLCSDRRYCCRHEPVPVSPSSPNLNTSRTASLETRHEPVPVSPSSPNLHTSRTASLETRHEPVPVSPPSLPTCTHPGQLPWRPDTNLSPCLLPLSQPAHIQDSFPGDPTRTCPRVSFLSQPEHIQDSFPRDPTRGD